jgi:hypothetical protein
MPLSVPPLPLGNMVPSASSITVATNAVLLKRVEPHLCEMTDESRSAVPLRQVARIR